MLYRYLTDIFFEYKYQYVLITLTVPGVMQHMNISTIHSSTVILKATIFGSPKIGELKHCKAKDMFSKLNQSKMNKEQEPF